MGRAAKHKKSSKHSGSGHQQDAPSTAQKTARKALKRHRQDEELKQRFRTYGMEVCGTV